MAKLKKKSVVKRTRVKKIVKQQFSWKNHFKETFQENKKFFIAIVAFMGISIVLGVAKMLLAPPTPSSRCQQQITQAIENKTAKVDLNCKYK